MKKKLLTLILLLVTVFGVFAVSNFKNVEAANITGGTVLYLKPNSNWTQSNARFAAYFFGNGEKWVSMTQVLGDSSVYEVTAPAGTWKNVIFCRMNPANSTNNWNNKWNQTGDLTYNGTNNLCTIKSGQWDCGTNVTWSSYTAPALLPVGTTLYLEPTNLWDVDGARFAAYFFGAGEQWVDLTDEDGNNIYSVTIPEGKWTNVIYCRMDGSKSANTWDNVWSQTIDLKVSDSNNCFKITTYDKEKQEGKWSVYTPVYEELYALYKEYYGTNGAYTKLTQINANVNEDSALYSELENLVHAYGAAKRVQTKKTTYYSGDILWFADGHGYGKSADNKLTSIRVENNDAATATVKSTTSSLPGMETYYCTLLDFKQGSHNSAHSNNQELNLMSGWTKQADGSYKNESAAVIDAFILFTAPTWLDTKAEHFIDYTHVTVQVVNNQLVMKLWVSSTELGGKLIAAAEVVGEYAVFSQATISKGIVA